MTPFSMSFALVLSLFSLLLLLSTLWTCETGGLNDFLWRNRVSNTSPDVSRLLTQDVSSQAAQDDEFLLGVGKADITGPVVEINFMGYADPDQNGEGLRQRLYSRAFIVGSQHNSEERFVYLVLDTQSGDTAVRFGILEALQNLGPEYSAYNQQNIAVTGTHSHSGPGAWLNYLLPQVTSRGFDHQSYQAIVSGAVLSIKRAHEKLSPGRLSFGATQIQNANTNRSPFAYLANPKSERDRYENNVDKTMSVLKFQRSMDNMDIGMLTWFPVHGTSMYGNNTLVTGDNKGVAAWKTETYIRHNFETATADFVAGFSQSNVGDTSPNIMGAYCEDGSGEKCTFERSLCSNRTQPCHGRGPAFGHNDAGTKSCLEIGWRQASGAISLYERGLSDADTFSRIAGPVRAVHAFRDFSNFTFRLPNGTYASTCPAALGYSFAAGTTDGPGAFDFKQNSSGNPDANPLWAAVRDLIHKPSEEQIRCQAPKPILLDAGETTFPYLWAPNVVDIQTFRVGQLFIIVSPGETTTMAGRRWKDAVAGLASSALSEERNYRRPFVVLGGPANTYAHYVTTEEEYAVQRYEGASTLYGSHTLSAFIKATAEIFVFVRSNTPTRRTFDPGPTPPNNVRRSVSYIRPVVFDSPGLFRSFGQILTNVRKPENHIYKTGDSVSATFVGANPRNNLRLEGTFAIVERRNNATSTFERHADDWDWHLVYRWQRKSTLTGTSEVNITWEIPPQTQAGLYRMKYFGDYKVFGSGEIRNFTGVSDAFQIG